MYCRICGSVLENGAKYCGNCGSEVISVVPQKQVQMPLPIQEEIVEVKEEKIESKASDSLILTLVGLTVVSSFIFS